MWSLQQRAEVKRLFGECSKIYGLALTDDPRLVSEVRVAVIPEYQLEAVIQQLTSGDESRVDVDRANHLLQDLVARRDGRRLLLELEQSESYLRTLWRPLRQG